MLHFTNRLGLTSFFVAGITCALSLAPGNLSGASLRPVYAGTLHGRTAGITCHTTKVVLNGTNPPSVSCVDTTSGGISPNTVQTGCNPGDLYIFDGPNQNAPERACFSGQGTVDLYNIPWGACCGQNWDNRAESYSAGSWYGKFYTDSGSGGAHWVFSPSNTVYAFNSAFKDQASSLCLNSTSYTHCTN